MNAPPPKKAKGKAAGRVQGIPADSPKKTGIDPEIQNELDDLLAILEGDRRSRGQNRLGIIDGIMAMDSDRVRRFLATMDVADLKKYQDYFIAYDMDLTVQAEVLKILGKKLKPQNQEWLAEFSNDEIRHQLLDIWGLRLSPSSVWYLIKKGDDSMHRKIFDLFGKDLDPSEQGMLVIYGPEEMTLKIIDLFKPGLHPELQVVLAEYCDKDIHQKLLDIMGSGLDRQAQKTLMEYSDPSIKSQLPAGDPQGLGPPG